MNLSPSLNMAHVQSPEKSALGWGVRCITCIFIMYRTNCYSTPPGLFLGAELSDSVAMDHTHSTDNQQDTQSAELQGN